MSEPADLLPAIGVALYGRDWQMPLAAALDVTHNTLDGWLRRRRPVPAGVWLDLANLLQKRAGECARLEAAARVLWKKTP